MGYVGLTIFLISGLMAFFATPLIKIIATRLGVVDSPNERKIHKGLIPRLGGIAIFLSVLVPSAAYFLFFAKYVGDSHSQLGIFLSFMAGSVLMLLLGLADDTKRMRASRKLCLQLAIATVVYILGFRVYQIRFFDGLYLQLGMLSFPFTVLWIVFITNAVNLVDGMDGLASGVATIAFGFIAVIAALFGNFHVAILSLALCGALIGFMRYNFHPATIFMGDSGSLFLGFVLSVFSLQAMRNGHLQFSIFVPLFLLSIPILDTFLAILRRFVKYHVKNDNGDRSLSLTIKKILYPDNEHIHHRLLAKGFSQKRISIFLYAASVGGGVLAVAFNYLSDPLVILLLTSVALGTIKFVDYLNYSWFSLDGVVAIFQKEETEKIDPVVR